MTAFFRFRKIFFRLLDPFDLAFGIVSRGTDSGIKDRRCQTVRISVILISYGNISKIIGKNSFFQSKLCDSSKGKDPDGPAEYSPCISACLCTSATLSG